MLKAELLAAVSHELRSPLTSIKGYASTLLRHERRISRHERHEFLVAIVDASNRLESIINRLLEMSQLKTGAITPEQQLVPLIPLMHQAIVMLKQDDELAKDAEITLHVARDQTNDTDKEVCVIGDRLRLLEVFKSILENALLYSTERKQIDVTIHLPEQNEHTIKISIRDDGIGIAPEHVHRIFDHFHRVDTRLTRETNGLGVGLAISKHIIELHGGSIWAESELEKGSTFHILLPAAPVTDSATRVTHHNHIPLSQET